MWHFLLLDVVLFSHLVFNQSIIDTVSRDYLEETAPRRGGACMGLSERHDAIFLKLNSVGNLTMWDKSSTTAFGNQKL